MAKRFLNVGDEFRKGLTVVRVTSVDPTKKYPVEWEWVVFADGSPRTPETKGCRGNGSHSSGFKFFEGEGFTHHGRDGGMK
jgi:hypothetical protein